MTELRRLEVLGGVSMPVTAALFPLIHFSQIYDDRLPAYTWLFIVILLLPALTYAMIGAMIIVAAYTESKTLTGLSALLLIPIVQITFGSGEWSSEGIGAVFSKMAWLPVPIYAATVAISIYSRIYRPNSSRD